MSDAEGDRFFGDTVDMVVPHSLDGERVDRVVAMASGRSRAEVREILRSGAASLDGLVVNKDSLALREGSHLFVRLPELRGDDVEPDGSVPLEVALEDRHFLVVNKAPGQVVHPSAGRREATLVAGVIARYPEVAELGAVGLCSPERPGVVHRLDRGTSGLLVFARTPEALASLGAQLRDRTVTRQYVALVQGHLANDHGVVDAPIGRSARQPTLMAVRSDGRPARTAYDVVARFNGPDPVSLLSLHLETGRTHQIRVHMASIGHPLVNDLRYGHHRDDRLDPERFFLHSASLGFRHPDGGQWVETSAPLPEDLRATLPANVAP